MNRRELFQKLAATVAVGGVAGQQTLSAVTADTKPALFVIEHRKPVSLEVAERIANGLADTLKGTPFEGVKCLVLSDGLRLTVLDASGKVMNERIEPEVTIAMDGADLSDLVKKPGGVADQVIDAVSQGMRGRDDRLRRGLGL